MDNDELLGEPSRNMSVHLHEPIRIVAKHLDSQGPCETIVFGRVHDFALYFSGPDQLQLENLERLARAVADAQSRIQTRLGYGEPDA